MGGPGELRTGVDMLDEFLGGALPRGITLDVYGPGGSGKSQVLTRAAAEAAAGGFRVAFVDTTGHFRPERVLQMRPQPAALDRIMVLRATSVAEQVAAPARIGDMDMLLVDNVTDLFSYEYSGEGTAPARGRMLGKHMLDMSRRAARDGIAVMVANTVRYDGDGEAESMRRVMDLYTHVKVRLSGGPEHIAECRTWNASARFKYRVYEGGIRSEGTALSAHG